MVLYACQSSKIIYYNIFEYIADVEGEKNMFILGEIVSSFKNLVKFLFL